MGLIRKVQDLPNLSSARIIGIDTETRDPDLKTLGPGGARFNRSPKHDAGNIVGVSIAVEGWSGYIPLAHEGGGNIDGLDGAIHWLQDTLQGDQDKLGANILYDVEWLHTINVQVKGRWIDIQGIDALLFEYHNSYSLDNIAKRRLQRGKKNTELIQRVAELVEQKVLKCRGTFDESFVKSNLYKLHSSIVADYAMEDAVLLLDIWEQQKREIEIQGLSRIVNLEIDLLPVLHAMRMKGTPISRNRAMDLVGTLARQEADCLVRIEELVGFKVNPRSPIDQVNALNRLNIPYPITNKGNPSLTASWLQENEKVHPVLGAILKARRITNLRGTFVQKMVLGHQINERIFTSFHPLKGDSGGAVTGRFSSSHPNLQQVPKRDEDLADLVRSLFVPEPDSDWWCFDYSQVEPRILVHYASMYRAPKSQEAVKAFTEDINTDYHNMVAQMTGLKRQDAKSINLGFMYGMGKRKLQHSLNVPESEAEQILEQYHERLPFVRAMSRRTSNQANANGYLITLGGRRERFPFYEKRDNWKNPVREFPLVLEEAVKKWPREILSRAMTYKALNKLIQGSAADVVKQAMIAVYRQGYIAHVTVHDELDFSLEKGDKGKKDAQNIKSIMEHCVQLEVPLLVDAEKGENWGSVTDGGL